MKQWVRAVLLMGVAFAAGSVGGGASPWTVEKYGEAPAVTLSDLERSAAAGLSEVVQGFAGGTLALDSRLVLLARQLAAEILKNPSQQSQILSSILGEDLKKRYGIFECATRSRSFFITRTTDTAALIKSAYPTEQLKFSRVGAGVALEEESAVNGVLVVIAMEQLVDLVPFPVKVSFPSSVLLRGELINRARQDEPIVLLTPPDGKVKKMTASVSGPYFSAEIPFREGEGRYRIQVAAKSSEDTKMAALLIVEAGAGGKEAGAVFEVSGFARPPVDTFEAEEMMIEMINRVRVQEGLSRLTPDRRLTEMARRHSEDMQRNKFIGHFSPEAGGLEERKAAAGLEGYVVRENVAQNTSLVQAMNSLLQSPSHRAAILDPEMTRVGVGVTFDDTSGTRHYFVVQEFAKVN